MSEQEQRPIFTSDATAVAAVSCQGFEIKMQAADTSGTVIFEVLRQKEGKDPEKPEPCSTQEYEQLRQDIASKQLNVTAHEFFQKRHNLIDQIFEAKGEPRDGRRPVRDGTPRGDHGAAGR